jgi:hypothetical protein
MLAAFCCTGRTATAAHPPFRPDDRFPDYRGAGIAFTDCKMVLCGRHAFKKGKAPFLSGFGGGKSPHDIDWIGTAWRETIEELWGVPAVPPHIVNQLRAEIKIRHILIQPGYVQILLHFEDLKDVGRVLRRNGLASPLYTTYPSNLEEWILGRRIGRTEITHLCLIPFLDEPLVVAPEFAADVGHMLRLL